MEGSNRLVLKFRPYTHWARTILYEYFSMSWAMRVAAENTTYAPLAARLVGESFELAIKSLSILMRGPGQPLTTGHNLEAIMKDTRPLEEMLRKLWGSDLEYVVGIVDGECNPSQVRYGASGGRSKHGEKIIPSGHAETAGVWTLTTKTLYEELMLSVGLGIWSNYPDGDRHGNLVQRRIKMTPAKGTPEGPRPVSEEEERIMQSETLDPRIWAFILKAESVQGGDVIPYWGIIPMDRLQDLTEQEFFVRARVSPRTVVDVVVKKEENGLSVGDFRMESSHDVGEIRLAIYSANATLPNRGEGAQ